MKRTLLLLFLPVLLCSSNGRRSNKENSKVDSISIRTVIYNGRIIQTPSGIKCSNFERSFDDIETFCIKSPDQIAQILKSIRASVSCARVKDIDTRAKIRIYYSAGRVDSMCMDDSGRLLREGHVSALQDNGKYLLELVDSLYQLRRR